MEEKQDLFDFKVDDTTARELHEGSRWAKLFSIIVFILCGVILLFLISVGGRIAELFTQQMANSEGSAAVSVILIVAILAMAIVGIMTYFLLRSANRIREGLRLKDQALFNRGLTDMKTYFAIFGVISIIGVLGKLISAI